MLGRRQKSPEIGCDPIEFAGLSVAVVVLFLPHFQRRYEGFLRNRDAAIFAHTLLALFLLIEQLFLSADIPAIAFRGHVFPQGRDGFAGDNFAANRRLNRDFEQVPRDQIF